MIGVQMMLTLEERLRHAGSGGHQGRSRLIVARKLFFSYETADFNLKWVFLQKNKTRTNLKQTWSIYKHSRGGALSVILL